MEKKYSSLKMLLRDIQYCLRISWKASPRYTLLQLFASILTPACSVGSAYAIKCAVDVLTGDYPVSHPGSAILLALCFTGLTMVLTTVLRQAVSYTQGLHTDLVNKTVVSDMMEKAMSADLELYDSPAFYDKLNLVRRDSTALVRILWYAIDTVSSLVTLAGTFVIIASMNLVIALVVLVLAVPSGLASYKYTKSLFYLEVKQMTDCRKRDYMSMVASVREYAQDVRLFGIAGYIKARYNTLWSKIYFEKKQVLRKRTVTTTLFLLLPDIALLIIYGLICENVLEGKNTVGDFTYYSSVISQFLTYTLSLINALITVYENRLKIQNVSSFREIPQRIADGSLTLSHVGIIEFRDICFTYPGTDREVLSHVSFRMESGERVAVVGLNGAGKTTLIKLLLRFYDPTSGAILINGEDIRNFTLRSLRDNFSAYLQSAANYGFSLRDNVMLSDLSRNGTDDDVAVAMHRSGASGILSKGKGLDSYLSRAYDDSGLELSGGESQKIALARMFFRRCTALILDEPSSSLDPESESELFRELITASTGKTTLFTSHRLTNITLAQRVVVIENGRVIEEGTEKQLLQQNGRYAELYRYQAEKFRADRMEEEA